MPQIRIAGTEIEFACAGDDTILRAALRHGLGFPYECNVGSCGNCRFELLAGEVAHVRADAPAWSERDRQRNRFLGCQARASADCDIKVRLLDHYRSRHLPRRTRAHLIATQDLTHDLREFRFRLVTPNVFRPGQYALLYLPGIAGGRAYSMSNLPGHGADWHFQIKRVPNGAATGRLFEGLRAGDEIGIDGPFGMAYLREEAPRDALCVAGGSGLSPMISIARGFALSPATAGRSLHFLYGGRAPRDICGEELLRPLPGFGTRIHFTAAISDPDTAAGAAGWSGRVGFVTDVARELFGPRFKELEIYFAGPPPMATALAKMLFELKVPAGQIHYDQFF
jgi:toluene monooxygenase electron transfer component